MLGRLATDDRGGRARALSSGTSFGSLFGSLRTPRPPAGAPAGTDPPFEA